MRWNIDRHQPRSRARVAGAASPVLGVLLLLATAAPALAEDSDPSTSGTVALVPSPEFCSDGLLYVTDTVPGTNWIVQITHHPPTTTLRSGVAPTSREAVKAPANESVTLTVYSARDLPIAGLERTIVTAPCSAPLPAVSASQVCSTRVGVATVSVNDPAGAGWEIYHGPDSEAEGHTSLVVDVQNLAGDWTLYTIDAGGQLVRPQRIPMEANDYCGGGAQTVAAPKLPDTGRRPEAKPSLLQEVLRVLSDVLRRLVTHR